MPECELEESLITTAERLTPVVTHSDSARLIRSIFFWIICNSVCLSVNLTDQLDVSHPLLPVSLSPNLSTSLSNICGSFCLTFLSASIFVRISLSFSFYTLSPFLSFSVSVKKNQMKMIDFDFFLNYL